MVHLLRAVRDGATEGLCSHPSFSPNHRQYWLVLTSRSGGPETVGHDLGPPWPEAADAVGFGGSLARLAHCAARWTILAPQQ
eukprot:1950367-Rhodomonas_salina.3